MEMSLPRNSVWVEERRKGGRGRARHPGYWGQCCARPPPPRPAPAQLCPQVPSASLSPNPLLQSSRELVPPFPSPVSREIQMFGPSSALLSLAALPDVSSPPRAGVCAPQLGTLGRGTVFPRASTSTGASPMSPVTHGGPEGSIPLPAFTSLGGHHCSWGLSHAGQPGGCEMQRWGRTWGCQGQLGHHG